MLRLFGVGMGELASEVGNIVVHGEADSSFDMDRVVVPLKVDARV